MPDRVLRVREPSCLGDNAMTLTDEA